MSKLSERILAIAIIIVIVAVAVLYVISRKNRFVISEDTVGNLAGNLNNNGLFCESGGKVYFANPSDNNTLYVMNPDQTEIKKVYNLSARYINVGGNYIFFYGNIVKQDSGLGTAMTKPGMYMVSKKGKGFKSLTKEKSQSLLLVGTGIFYQHYTTKEGATFHLYDLNKSETKELLPYMINPAGYYEGKIYYNGEINDHHLYTMDTKTGDIEEVWNGDVWNPIRQGDYVYYMDIMTNYRLCRYNMKENLVEILTHDRVDMYNLYGNTIYYQKSSASEPALMRMNTDGSNVENIATGVYNSINITSTYTYFKPFGDDFTVYCTPTTGIANVKRFNP